MPAKIVCKARGATGVEDAFATLDDGIVQFMLVKFPVGSGTFKRNKFVYVHHIGPHCSALKRGKWNAELNNVLEKIRTSAGLSHSEGKASLTFELLVGKLSKVFVADDGTLDLAKLREEYNARLKEEEAKMVKDAEEEEPADASSPAPAAGDEDAPSPGPASPGSPMRVRKLATDLGATLPMIVKALEEDMGPFNWVTVRPAAKEGAQPELVQAGSNGLFELFESFPADQILFGVVRLGFGTGRFRRTKRVAFQWTGDNVGAVAKGRANESRERAKLMPCSINLTINGREEATIESVLRRLEKVFVVDNIQMESKKTAKEAVSAEEYVKALEEEQRATSAFYEEPEELPAPAPALAASPSRTREYDIEETVNLVHADEGGLTWAIFQIE